MAARIRSGNHNYNSVLSLQLIFNVQPQAGLVDSPIISLLMAPHHSIYEHDWLTMSLRWWVYFM